MSKKIASCMVPGTHGSTFGGNPLAMKIGSTVMDIIANKKFLKSVRKNSKYFHNELFKLKAKFPKIINEIRGRGFLIGIKLYGDQTNFIKRLTENRLLTIRAADNVVRILPPLNVKKKEIDYAIRILNKVCKEFN